MRLKHLIALLSSAGLAVAATETPISAAPDSGSAAAAESAVAAESAQGAAATQSSLPAPASESTPDAEPAPDSVAADALAGGVALSGFWEGWRARHAMGEKYESYGDYGTMANNTTACTKIDVGKRGWFSCEIYYDTEIHPGDGGGQHLISIMSQSASRSGPYDPAFDHVDLDGWIRLDFGVRENVLRSVIYQKSDTIGSFVADVHEFRAWKQWAPLRVEWEQFDDSLLIVVNGRRSVHEIEPGRNPIGNLLFVGNMDRNTGERCSGEHDPCGTLGTIRYRTFEWGRQ